MTNPIYDQKQIIFSLNSIANAPSNHKGTVKELETIAKKVITETLSNEIIIELIGDWELVWGPIVNQEPNSKVADNTMYIAQNKNNLTDIVVAISGTNPISKYGWIHEDLLISPMQDWPFAKGMKPQPKISNGTKLGIDVLFEMVDNNLNQTLTEFLKNQVISSATPLLVTVTGHSLGGALSPAVALALKNLQGITDGWDPKTIADIAVLASAGATPGNKNWADYYDMELRKTTTRIWNAIDIVPHSWELDMLKEIPSLYEPLIPVSKFTSIAIKMAEINSIAAGKMHQICDSVPGLPGKVVEQREHKISDVLTILEKLQKDEMLNKVSKHLLLEKEDIKILNNFITELTEHFRVESASNNVIKTADILSVELESMSKMKGKLKEVIQEFLLFIIFMIEAIHQHVKAYSELLGTTEFADIVEKIKKEN